MKIARSLSSVMILKELVHLVVLEMTGQRLRETDGDFGYRIAQRHLFLGDEVIEEEPYGLEVTGDRLRR